MQKTILNSGPAMEEKPKMRLTTRKKGEEEERRKEEVGLSSVAGPEFRIVFDFILGKSFVEGLNLEKTAL
jgi:hypothetical protein